MIYIDFPSGAGKWLLGCWDPRVLICRTSSLKLPTAPAFEPSSTVLRASQQEVGGLQTRCKMNKFGQGALVCRQPPAQVSVVSCKYVRPTFDGW